MIQENFLYYIWQYKYFDLNDLKTVQGEPLILMSVGNRHSNSGPDFSEALIRIGETVWAGNIEIHVKSSDWKLHRHDDDAAYNSIVLHVVYEYDTPIFRTDGSEIPCFVLKNRIPPKILAEYNNLSLNEHAVPCHNLVQTVSPMVRTAWLERLLIERLEQKTAQLQELPALRENNIEEAFYQAIARSFGVNVNSEPFEQLAKSLPMTILAKNKAHIFTLEALIFGQAGLLHADFTDDYPQRLQREYQYLKHKYSLTPINGTAWKFLRMRPANFPTIRLAQFAQLIHQSSHLFSKLLETDDMNTAYSYFDVEVSDYWQTHFTFDNETAKSTRKTIGKTTIDLLFINTIIPFLFLYGSLRNEETLCSKALEWLENIAPEKNSILNVWQELGFSPNNAAESQSLLQLQKHYCSKKRCLQCSIGHAILGKK
ncbi:MAG: hypothetical protein RI894_2509 [Bacteroidota bacterium]